MTYAVDCALKVNYLSIHRSKMGLYLSRSYSLILIDENCIHILLWAV